MDCVLVLQPYSILLDKRATLATQYEKKDLLEVA